MQYSSVIELLLEADVTVLSERRKTPPQGVFGIAPGAVGKNVLIRKLGLIEANPQTIFSKDG